MVKVVSEEGEVKEGEVKEEEVKGEEEVKDKLHLGFFPK
jgi:hypothetical protein